MSTAIGFAIEGLVAALLTITIGYCVMLNRRLTRLKADEQTLKATISELITATEIAERAIAGLKTTVHECDQSLGQRLKRAEATSSDLARQIAAGDQVIGKLAQIAGVAGPPPTGPAPIVAGAQATAAAAQAFAARARLRAQGAAA
ncbi:MAG TPA: DUF6468 domain-containing protein [Xanthobacteraceae bacterium]|nr:DUF6468 domain-containing protein [Xanthobacteraceae bacterium]